MAVVDSQAETQGLYPELHPLKLFDIAASEKRYLYACAPMVRYSKLAFRQTVHDWGTDLCWTPMILAKEFNRSAMARQSDLTVSTAGPQPPTIAQFGANSPDELPRAASLAAPFVGGVDLNCGCPQSWACAETLGAALMERRELVRDMVTATRSRLRSDGWAVGLEPDMHNPRGRSVSVKIRVHKDLRKTVDWITAVLGNCNGERGVDSEGTAWMGAEGRSVDWLTIHPRTRNTPSSTPINVEALEVLTSTFGRRVPILVSGDVFTLSTLPYTSHLVQLPTFSSNNADPPQPHGSSGAPSAGAGVAIPAARPDIPYLRGMMSARALLSNPALFAGYDACPWEAVDTFLARHARAPLPLKLAVHHLYEMLGPGYGPEKRALINRRERARLTEFGSWIEVLEWLEARREELGAAARNDRA